MTSYEKMYKAQIKQLRRDARKLDTIAKHLRQEANELVASIKAEKKAAAARANFYSKQAKVDKDLTLVPDLPHDPFKKSNEEGEG